MKIFICIDDTDDLTKETSTGTIAQLIMKELKKMGGRFNEGISRHQLLLHEDIAYTSHNSSMCIAVEFDDISPEKVQLCAENIIKANMAAASDPGLAICIAEEMKFPEKLIEFGLLAKRKVLTKQEAYELANSVGGVVLKELGGDGSGVIGALAGAGLRISRSDGTFRGKIGKELCGLKMTAAEMCKALAVEQIVSVDGHRIAENAPVMIENFVKLSLTNGKITALAKLRQDGVYIISSMHQDTEKLFGCSGELPYCNDFVLDNDEEECISVKVKACFNCLYRRWTKDGFNCLKALLVLFLACGLLFPQPCFAADTESPILAEGHLLVAVRVGNDIVFEKEYDQNQLKKLPQVRQCYTSLDGDDTPQLIAAEGVLLTDLLKNLKIEQEDFKSIRLYCAEGTSNSLIKHFLFGVKRYSYPNLVKAWQEEEAEEPAEEDVPKTDAAEGAVAVQPMLAILSYEESLALNVDWSKLNQDDGYRLCYGQLSPGNVCSSLYGRHINKLEIILDAKSNFGKTEEEIKQAAEKDNGGSVGGMVNNSAEDIITGPVKDSQTGEILDDLPDTLTIKVGYFGTEYYTKKVFTMAELRALPWIKQAYTLIDEDSAVVVETAVGVRLTDLLAASGIDVNSVENFYFYTADKADKPSESMTKMYLLDTAKYFYPKLPLCWDTASASPTSGAAAGSIKVDTIIAFKDYWKKGSTVPDFYKVKSNDRFRLVFGQTNTTVQTASRCINWIDVIEVQLGGTPPPNFGSGIAASMKNSQVQDNRAVDVANKKDTQKVQVPLANTTPKASVKTWHMYEVVNNSQGLPEKADQSFNLYVGAMVLLIFISGAGIKCVEYRKEMANI